MKCLDYRRILLAGTGETGAMHEHRLECVFCSDLYREQALFEGELRCALDVPVPEGFAERLVAAAPASGGAPAPRSDRRRFLAATALADGAAGAAAMGLYAWLGRDDPMAMACIDFVMKDEDKSIMMGAMPRAEAARALAQFLPVERLEGIGKVMHIAPCPFMGGTAYHVVLMVPQDKVTLLVMPGTTLAGRARAAHDGMYARVVARRKGAVGIVGANAAVVESVAGALRA